MDLTAAQQSVREARAAGNEHLHKLVERFMPGVSDLEMKPFRFSATSVAYVAVGTWCDQAFEFEQFSDGTVRGYAVALCSACNNYDHCIKARALRTPADIADAIDNGVAATWTSSVDQCHPCREVAAAKAAAETVAGRYAAWRFKSRWGRSHTDVLALPH